MAPFFTGIAKNLGGYGFGRLPSLSLPTPLTDSSVLFDGNNDALTLPSSSALAPGSGDFTVEGWVYNTTGVNLYPDVWANSGVIIAFLMDDRSGNATSFISDDNYPAGGNSRILTASSTISQNTWVHVAWVRSGTTITAYINGVASGSNTSATNHTREMQVIGAIGEGSPTSYLYFFDGYISNVRLVKGTAVYTSGFTPPSSPLTAITNTSLLALQSPSPLTDNSTNNFTITIVGGATISTNSPF